ncbi:MAG TPA: SDR family NAD(P)-dependent oxidoreductase [Actinomycetota bacterium]|jgi:short-subunit dehydrogenase|nr:SDR family NAD(P)-dependent oxidoreductase [Actinomycetota bacterium]
MRLQGAVALVTGASGGIGRAVAVLLAERGARLALTGRDQDALAAVAERTGGQVITADLAEPGAAERVAEQALGRWGRVDLLVSNAGAGWAGELVEMPPGVAERLLALNLLAPVCLTRLVLPGMLERGSGHLSYVGSIAGATGVGREAVYAASKAGLATFADSVREEVAGRGVTVSVVVPGVVDTPFFYRRGSAYDRAWPAPIAPERVGRALLRGVEGDRAEVFAPAWMRLPARFKGAVPSLYRTLALRFGQAATAHPGRGAARRHR